MNVLERIKKRENDEAWWRQHIQDLVFAASRKDSETLRHSDYAKSQERFEDFADVRLPANATLVERGSGPGANLIILQYLNPSCTLYGYEQIEPQAAFSKDLIQYYIDQGLLSNQAPRILPTAFEGNDYFRSDYVLHSNIDITFDDVLSKLCQALPILTGYAAAPAAKLILRFADSIGDARIQTSHREQQIARVFDYFPHVERVSNVLIISEWSEPLLQKIPRTLKYFHAGSTLDIAQALDAMLEIPQFEPLRMLVDRALEEG